ncbi:MAG: sulfatase, partial [Acidobacteria bacterium]|nr:sulfatase [Acidobacteriota bacterium]
MLTRRQFGQAMGAGAAVNGLARYGGGADARPNILWITSEDNGPFLGCYGDAYARTPNLDRLAAEGILYKNCYAAYPVCAPARSTLITGVWSNSLGTQQMRSIVPMPREVRMFPSLLREAGYYCTNNPKEDYNTETPKGVWHESSIKATYRNRPSGAPFFHMVNIFTTHESSLFKPHRPIHDPARAMIPPYHPDTPIFRESWAQYYDQVTLMDEQAGAILRQFEEDGLAANTIVFYFSDNGGVLPRSKRFVYESGIHVPLIVRIPERLRHLAPFTPGTKTDQLTGYVDFAPTVLNLAGIPIPSYMQGQAFSGPRTPKPRDYIFAARDRMGSCPDMAR